MDNGLAIQKVYRHMYRWVNGWIGDRLMNGMDGWIGGQMNKMNG